MDTTRRSGVLLHPTALPGPYGRGDLGPPARGFVDALAAAGQSVWQILPLGPPGFGGSPYAATSAFASDALLVSPALLVEQGLLEPKDLADAPQVDPGRVAQEAVDWRGALLRKAWTAFHGSATAAQRDEFAAFRGQHAAWLEDYALFETLRAVHGGGAFWACGWSGELYLHEEAACRAARDEHQDAIDAVAFGQFLFESQWSELRAYARSKQVEIMGDVPIFVARDSVDVWSKPELFLLDEHREPSVVAGVPPDTFSETGQLWGNPLYDWDEHRRTGYAWWIERFRRCFEQSDLIRLDHFRGFASYWEVPADAPTAEGGKWIPGPRMELFDAIRERLGELPIVAEDLGVQADDVTDLLSASGFPGMRVLQFAWSGEADHPFLPENHPQHGISYTGTHDNETTAGWFQNLEPEVRERVVARCGEEDVVGEMIRLSHSSPAFLSVVPLQDVLGLDNEARYNSPGTTGPLNWTWRLLEGQLTAEKLDALRSATEEHGRLRTSQEL